MTTISLFWAITGVLTGIALCFALLPLWRVTVSHFAYRKLWWLAGVAGLFCLVSFGLYRLRGNASSVEVTMASTAAPSSHTNDSATGNAGSLTDVTARLAARLATSNGTDADWQLLQQSYEFLGDADAAALAAKHQLAATVTASSINPNNVVGAATAQMVTPSTTQTIDQYQQDVAKNPKDASAWRGLAEAQRAARNFVASQAAFEQLIKLKVMDADAWSDYADAAASVAGKLANAKSRDAIDVALKLAPQQSKALWLKASLAYEEKRYADALQVWQQLRTVTPDTSTDAAIVDANIAEAKSLAGLVDSSSAAQAQGASISGSVDVDAALKSKAADGMTLFVYAKSNDSPMPVAAYRTTVNSWPVKFVLDDSLAMLPTRKLSQFERVTVEARLSRSGQALAQSGDLQADLVSAATDAHQSIALRLTKVVP